jgi:hypothetical protein
MAERHQIVHERQFDEQTARVLGSMERGDEVDRQLTVRPAVYRQVLPIPDRQQRGNAPRTQIDNSAE